jgi:redox-sensitive bicupin YhaK (pirin superfamily)
MDGKQGNLGTDPAAKAQARLRHVRRVIKPQTVMEGAGVKLKRSIATHELDYVDPFLLFDHFGSEDPEDYVAGFPMHPHRGIETVTYMLSGVVRHRDSIGNSGSIREGDVQWMTAGRGIMHEEMPQPSDGGLVGFQLWVNLPARLKMTPPRYQEVPSVQIPEVRLRDGIKIRVIAGSVGDTRGPVTDIAADPTYFDVFLPPNGTYTQEVSRGHSAFAYVFEGEATFAGNGDGRGETVSHPGLVVFDDGDYLEVRASSQPARLLLVSGKPLHEPIARYGPFVMNTQEEILQALRDLRDGTFV